MYKKVNEADPDSWFVEGLEKCGSVCHSPTTGQPKALKTSLLQTCSQVYDEARFIAFSSNTFSFHSTRILRNFTHKLKQPTADFNLALRSLHLQIACRGNAALDLERTVNPVIDRMKNIESFKLTIRQTKSWCFATNPHVKLCNMKSILYQLTPLNNLRLQTVQVVLIDIAPTSLRVNGGMFYNGGLANRWTNRQRRAWAQKLEQTLLQQDSELVLNADDLSRLSDFMIERQV